MPGTEALDKLLLEKYGVAQEDLEAMRAAVLGGQATGADVIRGEALSNVADDALAYKARLNNQVNTATLKAQGKPVSTKQDLDYEHWLEASKGATAKEARRFKQGEDLADAELMRIANMVDWSQGGYKTMQPVDGFVGMVPGSQPIAVQAPPAQYTPRIETFAQDVRDSATGTLDEVPQNPYTQRLQKAMAMRQAILGK